MDEDLEERVYSFLRGRRDFEEYPSISGFRRNLVGAPLTAEKLLRGWFFWNPNYSTQPLNRSITDLLKHILLDRMSFDVYLVQFWEVVKVEGRYHYLSASHHPFYISDTYRCHIWYRNACVDHVYRVDMEEGAEEELIGGVGRAYRNKRPESTPDLRLYSMDEFPLRDEAARCGFRGYSVLPLFDLLDRSQCSGVLEFISRYAKIKNIIPRLNQGLQVARLRSTHTNFISFSDYDPTIEMADKYKQQPESEITAMLQLCIKLVPQLSLAQVWIPCKQCADTSSAFSCMERTSFVTAPAKNVNSLKVIDQNLYDYLQSCEFQDLRVLDCGNLYDVNISKDPLAHYARRARLQHCFAVCVENLSNTNEAYVLQFLLQSKDAFGDSSVHLLLRIIEMKLKRFKLLAREQFPVGVDVQSRLLDMLDHVMNSHAENLSEWNFIEYMETADLCCLRPFYNNSGWVFRLQDKDVQKKKMVHFLKKVAYIFMGGSWMVQFWAPKMVDNKCYLETSNQPYALGCLAKGLASFRKQCLKHDYSVDEEAKEEELGPPGRVFRNGHPEITLNLVLYSTKEFPLRSHAVQCCLQQYFALPVFSGNSHKCVGVLELLGFNYLDLERFGKPLKAAELYSTHIDFRPMYLGKRSANTIHCKKNALYEVSNALRMITKIPQLHEANVWVPRRECVGTNSNLSCMELALASNYLSKFMPMDQIHWIHVLPRKGILGMVLASENKSCFCRNTSEFSIVDNPPSHYERSEKGNVCFAICLQSSHTGDLLYVLQFFLYQGHETYGNLHSFLNFLMPVMKKELPTFKVANGKELGQELVVDVIEFSEANTLTSYDHELDQTGVFPVKFKSVVYGQQEHQHIQEQQLQSHHQRQAKQCNFDAAFNFKKTEKGKRKTNPLLSLEILKPHFGKKLENVSKELGVGRSTIKRACRDLGIDRWPSNKKQARNQSLFEAESTQDLSSSNNLQVSSSNSAKDLDISLQQNVPHGNTESKNVMVKVKYGEDTIKFELCLSLGVNKLFQEVARRLNLKMSSFKLRYKDDDGDEILITCDDDLKLCAKSRTSTDKACIQLFVPKQV